MSAVVCEECQAKLNHGPLWCPYCTPGRVLCAACMTVDKTGNLICRRCRDSLSRLKKPPTKSG